MVRGRETAAALSQTAGEKERGEEEMSEGTARGNAWGKAKQYAINTFVGTSGP